MPQDYSRPDYQARDYDQENHVRFTLSQPDEAEIVQRPHAAVVLQRLGIPAAFIRLPSEALYVDGTAATSARLYGADQRDQFDELWWLREGLSKNPNMVVTVGDLKRIAREWITDSIGLAAVSPGSDRKIIGWQIADPEGCVLDAETNPFGLWSHQVMLNTAVDQAMDQLDVDGDYRFKAVLEGDIEDPDFVESLDHSMKMN